MPSPRLMNATPSSLSSSRSKIKWRRDLPRRSSFQTISVSTLRRLASRTRLSSAGRESFEPDTPMSTYSTACCQLRAAQVLAQVNQLVRRGLLGRAHPCIQGNAHSVPPVQWRYKNRANSLPSHSLRRTTTERRGSLHFWKFSHGFGWLRHEKCSLQLSAGRRGELRPRRGTDTDGAPSRQVEPIDRLGMQNCRRDWVPHACASLAAIRSGGPVRRRPTAPAARSGGLSPATRTGRRRRTRGSPRAARRAWPRRLVSRPAAPRRFRPRYRSRARPAARC